MSDIPRASKIYVNGTILTVDELNSRAQAVAVSDHYILAVGTNEKVRQYPDLLTPIAIFTRRAYGRLRKSG